VDESGIATNSDSSGGQIKAGHRHSLVQEEEMTQRRVYHAERYLISNFKAPETCRDPIHRNHELVLGRFFFGRRAPLDVGIGLQNVYVRRMPLLDIADEFFSRLRRFIATK